MVLCYLAHPLVGCVRVCSLFSLCSVNVSYGECARLVGAVGLDCPTLETTAIVSRRAMCLPLEGVLALRYNAASLETQAVQGDVVLETSLGVATTCYTAVGIDSRGAAIIHSSALISFLGRGVKLRLPPFQNKPAPS